MKCERDEISLLEKYAFIVIERNGRIRPVAIEDLGDDNPNTIFIDGEKFLKKWVELRHGFFFRHMNREIPGLLKGMEWHAWFESLPYPAQVYADRVCLNGRVLIYAPILNMDNRSSFTYRPPGKFLNLKYASILCLPLKPTYEQYEALVQLTDSLLETEDLYCRIVGKGRKSIDIDDEGKEIIISKALAYAKCFSKEEIDMSVLSNSGILKILDNAFFREQILGHSQNKRYMLKRKTDNCIASNS